MIAKLREFRDLFYDIRDDEPLKERIAAVSGIVAVVFLGITLLRMAPGYTFAAPQAPSSSYHAGTPPRAPAGAASFQQSEYAGMKAQMYEDLRRAYGAMKSACMAGDLRITWIDPYTKNDMAAVCDVVALGRML